MATQVDFPSRLLCECECVYYSCHHWRCRRRTTNPIIIIIRFHACVCVYAVVVVVFLLLVLLYHGVYNIAF